MPRWIFSLAVCVASALLFTSACALRAPEQAPVELRLQVALTAAEMASFEPALLAVDRAHPGWTVSLETTPQSGLVEKINAQLAGNSMPDVVRIPGLNAQRWIRQNAFIDLAPRLQSSDIDQGEFYPGPLDQFRWRDGLWAMPDTAAPELVFYNRTMFDAAGLDYPTDDWTFEDMRAAAIQLTVDGQGRTPADPEFDPNDMQQWGWNGGVTNLWQRHLVQPFGADFCHNADCTLMNFTSPTTRQAVAWWASFVQDDYAAPYDPYSGQQTGIPGDPFVAGVAAMGFNGYFAVGQLNQAGDIDYDVIEPFQGDDGRRYSPLSTNGYLISSSSENPEQAWELIQTLLAPEFLALTWGLPGHSVPARRLAADSVLQSEQPPENRDAILAAMEYGAVFQPNTSSAFEAYGRTADLFVLIMRGEMALDSGLQQIETEANNALAQDRSP